MKGACLEKFCTLSICLDKYSKQGYTATLVAIRQAVLWSTGTALNVHESFLDGKSLAGGHFAGGSEMPFFIFLSWQ